MALGFTDRVLVLSTFGLAYMASFSCMKVGYLGHCALRVKCYIWSFIDQGCQVDNKSLNKQIFFFLDKKVIFAAIVKK